MTQQFFMTKQDLQAHFKPSLSVQALFQEIRRELLQEHKILTRIFVDEGSFESESSLELEKQVGEFDKIGYEFISVSDIVRDIAQEWIQVLGDIEQRSSQIGKAEAHLDLQWVKKETLHIQETFADLIDSFESIKEYFGDTLVAPFIQVDQVEENMKSILSDMNKSCDQNNHKEWMNIYHTKFVKVIEVWQTFFHGVFRIFN